MIVNACLQRIAFLTGLVVELGLCQPHLPPRLIIVSMDGLMPEAYLHPDRYSLRLPTLQSLMRRGTYSTGLESVYPSITYPAHASMATGVLPARHGIHGNTYYFDGRKEAVVSGRHYLHPPFWRQLGKKGITVGSVFWPVTADEPIDFLIPEAWWDDDKGNDARRLQKQAAISTPGLLDSLHVIIGAPLDKYFESDTVKTDAALYILEKYQPQVLLLHYSHLDYHQHVYGLFAPQVKTTLEMQDSQAGRLLAKTRELDLFDQTNFIIISDHGHAAIEWQINFGVALAQAGLLQLDSAGAVLSWQAMVLPAGGACSVILRDSADVATRARVLELASDFAADSSHGIEHVFTRAQCDSLGSDPRAVAMLEARASYAFGGKLAGEIIEPASNKATHGYLPSKTSMRAAFIAAGPNFRQMGQFDGGSVMEVALIVNRIFNLPSNDQQLSVIAEALVTPD